VRLGGKTHRSRLRAADFDGTGADFDETGTSMARGRLPCHGAGLDGTGVCWLMATDRILSPAAANPEEDRMNWALRPTRIDEYVGQDDLITRVRIAVQAAKQRKEPMEHLLLHGPPGLGKTTLAHVLAQEMGAKLHLTSGPVLAKGTDLVSCVTRLAVGDVLFIDEIHRLPIAVEEFIYPAMEDFRIDVSVDSGMNARTIQIKCKPFTLIGATTRAGLLSSPLRSRFGIVHHLKYYTQEELLKILKRSCVLLNMVGADEKALAGIAARSRGTPRIANRLLRRVRDFTQVKAGGKMDGKVVEAALALEGIDQLGLDELDRAYLRTIGTVYSGGPVGLEAIAATMNEDSGTLEDVVEPYLLQVGFLARTRRGRELTKAACEHLGIRYNPPKQMELGQ
jgi:holliday junction DNA helicase RuvB